MNFSFFAKLGLGNKIGDKVNGIKYTRASCCDHLFSDKYTKIPNSNEFSSLADSQAESVRASILGEGKKHERIEFDCSL